MPLTIIVAQRHYIALEIFVNTGPGNGLMPDGMKPLAQVDLNTHDINPKFSMKFTNLTLYRHHPGGNEFYQDLMNAFWNIHCLVLHWFAPDSVLLHPTSNDEWHHLLYNDVIIKMQNLINLAWIKYVVLKSNFLL